ncbi:P-loop containing nucleoside triphosphate hydrolase protein [Dioscorea alata]|uniref:P-loop containing nucleoside triphosphate hydrolase protein n=3 Tax=Dioscorea alata TaxID=55571 RepID=A0ACB7V6T6_DIOAL|nr:P-loop containing nucleoside triphosphate hydrolase protein [Dioscorea alata]
MGKSTSSCLKIITCGARSGGDSENEDLAETKAASENHRWSFRKKSSGHRVLSDSVISEPLSTVCDKETLQATTTKFDSPIHSNIPVKLQAEDKPKETLPLSPDLANSEVTSTQLADTKTESDDNVRESSAVVIQSAIRRYLAQKEHLKVKNVVKLQAVVRGHIVRRQAVGTLRCVQAIVKMQALVRVRYARQTIEKSTHSGNSNTKANKAQSSIQIVISNGFARQLLESAPKQKPIYINCEPSRPDSAAWEWLERWMAVTSSDIQEQILNKVDVPDFLEETNLDASEASSEVPITDFPMSSTSTLAVNGSAKPEDDDSIINTISGLEYQHPASNPCEALSSLEKVDQDNSNLEIQNFETSQLSTAKSEHAVQDASNLIPVETSLEQNEASESIPELTINKSDSENQSPKSTNKGEPVEIEEKRFAFGPRRMTNPVFAAVQSKFEELSSSQSMGRSVRSVDQDTSKSDNVQSKVDPLIKAMDYPLAKNSVSYDSKAQMASSECGTEISISSALGSPERSETESGETMLEAGAFVKENHGANDGANNVVNVTNLNAEANDSTSDLKTLQPQKNEGDGSETDLNIVAGMVPSEKKTPEPETSEIETHLEKPTDQLGYRSSPEGSPRRPTTIPESSGISSIQNSVNAKSSKKDIINQNQKAQMVEKRSPSTPINESGQRISTEQSPKDPKNAKRRTSFSTTKSDGVDHEPRLSSSKSLPSYMQATESARAKAHGSISPKSSPDVHDKDHARKRHSLPIANAKQDSSPRMQRSTSQAQQNAKERRWQR